MTEFATGAVLNDRYRLEAVLGRGGAGTVFQAHDLELDRDVALKILTSLGFGTDGRARLQQEAQAIAKLNHPNIVAVYDVGEVDNIPFIVMEYVNGQDLHRRAPDGFSEIVSVARQVSLALQHAHESGVIHRDLKPENVLVQSDGTAKLVDFGIARSVASRMTSEGQISGTVFYLAPELALGQDYDGRADLYALGVMLYELSVGSLPFDHRDPLAVVSQHVDEAAERVEEVLEIARETNSPFPEARALRILGLIHAHRGEAELAVKTFADAVKICEEWNSQLLAGRILLDWASLQVAHESKQTAAATLERSLEILEAAGAKYWVNRARAALDELAFEGVSQDG